MVHPMSEIEGNKSFRTTGHHARLASSSRMSQAEPRKAPVMSTPLRIGILVFPKVTQLDFTGPLQVFSSIPGSEVHLVWKRIEPVASDTALTITPTIAFADCPQFDV